MVDFLCLAKGWKHMLVILEAVALVYAIPCSFLPEPPHNNHNIARKADNES